MVSENPAPTAFSGWSLYFGTEAYSAENAEVPRIRAYVKYFLEHPEVLDREHILKCNSFVLNFPHLQTHLATLIPSLASDLFHNPSSELNCIGVAAYHVFYEQPENNYRDENPPKLLVRVSHFEPCTKIRSLKANSIGKFVSVTGTVVRVGHVKPYVTHLSFACAVCHNHFVVELSEGRFAPLANCPHPSCKGRNLLPHRASPRTKTIDWHKIKLQQVSHDDSREAGRIPPTIEVDLTADLVDCCIPGDIVTVTGIIRVSAESGGGFRGGKNMFLIYLEGNFVQNKSVGVAAVDLLELSVPDFYAVSEIHQQQNLFRLIVNSLCPPIFGHEIVKAGLVLALFGGSSHPSPSSSPSPSSRNSSSPLSHASRADSHVLIVGDPGLGKSQMLQAVTEIAPRGVYVCGNTTTSSGLTVTMVKEKGCSEYALEAGALVMADQGCCCIDEFDKLSCDHQSLLEAMEQQTISIAKAGIVCSLPARTAVIAAANPIGGHYQKGRTICENLRLPPALLSRFDLVFILLDRPDEEMDRLLSEHIMALHSEGATSKRLGMDAGLRRRGGEDGFLSGEQLPLGMRLKLEGSEYRDFEPIPHLLLRKYVSYARKYVHPVLSGAASVVIQNFYLELRQKYRNSDRSPITTRQLESMIRLGESRARLELRNVVTKQDALDVVEIMRWSLFADGLTDPAFDHVDSWGASERGGRKGQVKMFVKHLNMIANQTREYCFTLGQLRKFSLDLSLKVADFDEFINTLNSQGYLLKQGSRVYRLQTCEI